MSYKSILQEHNTKLQTAIDKANALPDAGSGTGIKTCTIKIVNECVNQGCVVNGVGYSRVVDGEVDLVYTENGLNDASQEITWENVVCGSLATLAWAGYWSVDARFSDNCELLNIPSSEVRFKVPTEAGAVGVMTLVNND